MSTDLDERYVPAESEAAIPSEYAATDGLDSSLFTVTEPKLRRLTPAPERVEALRRTSWPDAYEAVREQDEILCRRALDELGAHDSLLSDEERRTLDERGFLVLPDVLGPDELAAMHASLDAIIARAWKEAGGELPGARDPQCVVEDYETVVKNLVNRGPEFDVAFRHPRVLAAMSHILGGYLKLSYVIMRQPTEWTGHEEMHLDTHRMFYEPLHYFANTIWMLDDFTPTNGATRFVPGSHRFGKAPWDVLKDLHEPHRDEIQVCGRAGSVIVFDGHVWHGGMKNLDGNRRRALLVGWVHRNRYQIQDQRTELLPETYRRLDEPSRYLLDVWQEW